MRTACSICESLLIRPFWCTAWEKKKLLSSLFYNYLYTSPFYLSVFISPSLSLFLHLQFWHLYSTCNDHNCNTTHILFAITLLPFLPLKSLREKGIFLTPTCSNSKNIWFCFYIWKVKPSSVNFELLVSVSIFLLFYVQLCSMTSCILFFFFVFLLFCCVSYPK